MRLSFVLAPMMVFFVQTASAIENQSTKENESPVTCRSSDPHQWDVAHLVFELRNNLDYKDIVKVANEMVEESDDPDIQQIEVLQSKDYQYKDLPILVYDTGKYKVYQHHPEKELKFVVIRPIEDCFDEENRTHTRKTFVYSRAFEKEEINIAVVRQLLNEGLEVHPLTKRGMGWICAVDPRTPECAALLP